ncbi:hypothetical protein LUZ60_007566 [Juncus effusus]|nr:hypothetical protein LUZ60_007566 [Juncus effusus]
MVSLSLVRTFPSPFSFYCSPLPTTRRLSAPRSRALMEYSSSSSSVSPQRRLPVLLFDVMDTVVKDPFYHHIPAFFQMSMKELLEAKHPTAWVEFEKGEIDEIELAKKFFKDKRSFDLEGLKECMVQNFSYVDGIEPILNGLKQNNYEIHAFTNYPIWYMLIEEKLKLSKYLSWTFCSCTSSKRKPSLDSYNDVLNQLSIEPSNCVFVDDRVGNIEAAKNVGMIGLHFKNAELLKNDLFSLGIEVNIS